MQQAPPTAAEMSLAKDSILNSFVFRIDSKDKILHEMVSDIFHGYPPDLLERYQAGIAKVTADDVFRVARKYIDKSKLAVLVVGKASEFDKPLDQLGLGPVTTIDITIPTGQPKAERGDVQRRGGQGAPGPRQLGARRRREGEGVKAVRARGTRWPRRRRAR